MCRIRAHCVVRKKGWVLTSEAPARAPRRRFSSLMRSLRMRDLQRLGWGLVGCQTLVKGVGAYLEIWGFPDPSGKGTSSLRMFAKVAFRFLPLKGVVPYNIS